MRRTLALVGIVVLGAILSVFGASLYYESGGGGNCARCHEILPQYERSIASAHRSVGCEGCHGGAITLSPSFHLNNLARLRSHLLDDIPEAIRLRSTDVTAMVDRCAGCHRDEAAQWRSGPHSATYSRLFLNETHNRRRQLMDDCLRCHGMHFEGGIRDLVSPLDKTGPWRLLGGVAGDEPSIPCLACHQLHRTGSPLGKAGADGRVAGPDQEIHRPSLALYDRRMQRHVPVDDLVLPAIMDKERPVAMSRDQRQALCYQCHAAEGSRQVGSGDDRTPVGVHEGLSCLACHSRHGQKTRSSCATCHPRLSNCGLDVQQMDTTFRSQESKHNVHWVRCEDCHTRGVPRRRPTAEPSRQTSAAR
jgi:hypothetical protein